MRQQGGEEGAGQSSAAPGSAAPSSFLDALPHRNRDSMPLLEAAVHVIIPPYYFINTKPKGRFLVSGKPQWHVSTSRKANTDL